MKSLFAIVTLVGSVSFGMDFSAQKWTGQLDLRQQASEAATGCTGACTAETQTMFGAGATTAIEIGNQFALRTGGVLTQRGYKQSTAGTTDSVNYTYLDVPVLPEYKINEMFSAYAGVVVGLKAVRSCGLSGGASCDSLKDNALVTPFQVGGTYNIDSQWAARLTYETGATLTKDAANTDIKTANAITLGGSYNF